MSRGRSPGRRIVFAAVGFLFALSLRAATYQAGLGRRPRAPRPGDRPGFGRVPGSRGSRPSGGRLRPFTIVTLATLETIRGQVPEAFSVRLPGGRVGGTAAWIPGTPVFRGGSEVVLLLEPVEGLPRVYRLSEFGMSKFDLVTDDDGRAFAVRPAFGPREDLLAADRGDVLASLAEKSTIPARDAESFPRGAAGDRRRAGAGRDRVARAVLEGRCGAASEVGQHRRPRARRLRHATARASFAGSGTRGTRSTASSR